MFGKVKKWLGIEGVKMDIMLPEEIELSKGVVKGKIILMAKSQQVVTQIDVKLIEKFSRGRRKDKLTDEYTLGAESLVQRITIPAEEAIEIDFSLPFQLKKSEMDSLEDSNVLLGGAIKAAKWVRGVKSDYRLEVGAEVEGTMLDPFVKRSVNFI